MKSFKKNLNESKKIIFSSYSVRELKKEYSRKYDLDFSEISAFDGEYKILIKGDQFQILKLLKNHDIEIYG